MHKPKLKPEFVMSIEVPNQGMQVDLERIKIPLLDYLQEQLNNYSISMQIHVNEVIANEQVYTKEDKYKKLQAKNPLIDLLKTKFDLEL